MATVSRRAEVGPDAVWAVLADGWSYAAWVVGASRVRDVDDAWPAQGSKVHHSFGVWPMVIDDNTTVLESEPGRRLVLQARGWPAGEATVDITLAADGDGCVVTIAEDATKGPGTLVPEPARAAVLVPRNVETLRRLCLLADGRAHGGATKEKGR